MTPTLQIAGKEVTGWQSLEISHSLKEIAAQWTASLPLPATRLAALGDRAVIALRADSGKSHTLLTGYIERLNVSAQSESATLTLSGRARTCDIVDCTCALQINRSESALTLAQKICQPHGIKVLDYSAGAKATGAIIGAYDETQTGADALRALARACNLFIWCNESGSLVLSRPGAHPPLGATLTLGKNILSLSDDARSDKRHHTYRVVAEGSSALNRAFAGHSTSTATDASVRSNRVLVHKSESGSGAPLSAKAIKIRRAADGQEITLSVAGWLTETGSVWRPNATISVSAPQLAAAHSAWSRPRQLVIIAARYTLREAEGLRTELTLAPAAAISGEE